MDASACSASSRPTSSPRRAVRFSQKRSRARSANGRKIVTWACRWARRIQRCAPTANIAPPTKAAKRSRARPRRHEDDHSGQGRYREREQVDETPAEPPAGGPQVAGRDHPVAPAVRPAEAKARSGTDPVQDDVELMLSRREADVA